MSDDKEAQEALEAAGLIVCGIIDKVVRIKAVEISVKIPGTAPEDVLPNAIKILAFINGSNT